MTDNSRPRITAGGIVLVLLCVSLGAGFLSSGDVAAAPTHATPDATNSLALPATGSAPPRSVNHPTEITAGMGWTGIDYRAACAACVPADPQLAVGSGYVLELTNGTERGWLVNGTEVLNQSLDVLFNASTDVLADPQVQFDTASLHWFISAVDLTAGEILLGASVSSDPFGSWTLVPITPPHGSIAQSPLLAVDTTDIIVIANDTSANGTFEGAQVWVANKTALVNGGTTPTVAVGAPDPSAGVLVPATALSDASTLYLLGDGIGAAGPLQLFTVAGTPPDAVTLSGPMNFTTDLAAPPTVPQNETSSMLGVGSGAIQSVAWRSDTIWAAATVSCTPANDSQVRACLHLWQIDTATDTLVQDFVWSSGAGTYDFDPAVSIAVRGDLALVFGESSATTDPSIFVTGQAVTDPAGTLETPTTLHNGTGPYFPAIGCADGICPFAGDFALAFTPATNVHFWSVGEYASRDSGWDYWKTWVNQVAAWATVPVTFTESGLPAGTTWSVTVNGATVSSTTESLTVAEQNGSYTFLVLSPLPGGPGIRFVANANFGTFTVDAATIEESLAFVRQYEISTLASPAAGGRVYPGGGWFDASSTVSLSALASPGYAFESWTGTGPGAYAGTANPGTLTVQGPVTEQAHFWASATYPILFTEAGLPPQSNWTVTVNGISNGSTGPDVLFNEPNGSFSYLLTNLVSGAAGVQYAASPLSGSFHIGGQGLNLGANYQPEFELVAAPATAGSGVVNPADGWFAVGTTVNLSALAAPGELFVGWTGVGSGAYGGTANPAPIVMNGPITEEARFLPTTTFPVTYSEAGLPVGAFWSATTNGVRDTSSATTIVFNEPNGNYSFGIQTAARTANGTIYLATPSFGTLVVAGASVRESIQFGPVAVPPTASGTTSGGSTSGGIPVWVFGVALATFLVVVAVLALVVRARGDRVPESIVTYVNAPPPPDWDESSLARR
jgi:hypothetical protein